MNTERPPTTFHAFNLSIAFIRLLCPVVELLEQRDRDLARQLRKAASSVALNLGEGRKRIGRDRQHLWRIANGSAEECLACLLVAEAWGHVQASDIDAPLTMLDQLLAMCWRLTHR